MASPDTARGGGTRPRSVSVAFGLWLAATLIWVISHAVFAAKALGQVRPLPTGPDADFTTGFADMHNALMEGHAMVARIAIGVSLVTAAIAWQAWRGRTWAVVLLLLYEVGLLLGVTWLVFASDTDGFAIVAGGGGLAWALQLAALILLLRPPAHAFYFAPTDASAAASEP